MDEQKNSVPYIVHESSMARLERIIKRLWITVLVLILLLAASNGAWIWHESQYIDEVTTVEQSVDTSEGDAFVAGIGDINYGESPAESNEENPH